MAKFLIVKENDERLIDERFWTKYQSQGYRKVADVLAERKKKAAQNTEPVPTKAELIKKAEALGIGIPAKATVTVLTELIAAKEAENKPDSDNENGEEQ